MTHNQIIEQAVDYVERMGALEPDARYAIQWEGFTSGSTAGVSRDGALRYLYDLRSQTARDFRRFGRPLEYVTITAELPPAKFTA